MLKHRRVLSIVRLLAFIHVMMADPAVFANVVGSDAQNFNPTTSGLDFITVQSSATLEPGIFNLGMFLNFARNPLPSYVDGESSKKQGSSLVGGDLNFGLGLTENWDTGLSFPFILQQKIESESDVGHYSSTGNTEVRFNTKYRLLGTQSNGFAVIASYNHNQIGNNPYLGEKGGPIYNLEFAYKTMFGPGSFGLNLGYRWRNPGKAIPDSGIEPLVDQWIASTAFGYHFDSADTKVVLEIFGAVPKQGETKNSTDRQVSVAEALLGLKWDASQHFSFHLGGGGGLTKGTSSPDYRVYAGLNIAFGSLGKKQSAQVDPYAGGRTRARVARLKKSPKPPPVPIPEPAPEPLPVAIPETPVAKTPPSPPPPSPAPETPELVESYAVELVPEAVKSETINEVKVFDRGTYNHIVLQNIEFVDNTMTLKPESLSYLRNELTKALNELNSRRPITSITVEGHTDSRGDKKVNLQLSRARAQIVSAMLRKNSGIKIPIQAVGLGGTSPIADNGNYQGRAANNRVEIKLLYSKDPR